MPRTKNNEQLATNSQKGKKTCSCCKKPKNLTEFYLSYSPMYSIDQRTPICKECCKIYALNEDGTINYIKLKELLRQIDKPLYYDLLWSASESVKKENSYLSDEEVELHGGEVLSKFFTLVAMRQDRATSFSDAEKESFMHTNSNRTNKEKEKIINKYSYLFNKDTVDDKNYTFTFSNEENNEIVTIHSNDFEVTPEIINLFGDGYTKSEYKKMFEKYEKLKLNYSLQTNIHQESLVTYVRFKVREEIATAEGKIDEAKKWYDAANLAAKDGNLTPKQLSAADLQKGMNSVCELVKAVEQATDVIKIMPQFKYRPIDSVDFTIMCYINYERKLNGQPQVEYEDIYSFYDKKKEEYLKQNGDPYGIFEGDPTVKNRDSVRTFLKMPDDYDELAGASDD